jgi:drug/metabolite transporter (DMT)-like permease
LTGAAPGPTARRGEGAGLGVACAFSYGWTVLFGRVLAKSGVGFSAALGMRFAISALFLFGLLAAGRRRLVPSRSGVARAFSLGVCFYATQASLFYQGLRHGTAAAITLLFYAYPAFVVLMEIPLGYGMPSRRTLAALALSLGGAALIAGTSGTVSVSRVGVAFALAAGGFFGLYVLLGGKLLAGLEPRASALWVSAGTSSALLVHAGITGSLHFGARDWPPVVGAGMATAAAFSFLFATLPRLGPSGTSVVLTLEALFAILLAAIFLGETIGPLQMVGGACILLGAAVIATSARVPAATA